MADADIVDKLVIDFGIETNLSKQDAAEGNILAYVQRIVEKATFDAQMGPDDALKLAFDRIQSLAQSHKIRSSDFDYVKNNWQNSALGSFLGPNASVSNLEHFRSSGFLDNATFQELALGKGTISDFERWKKSGWIDQETYLKKILPQQDLEGLKKLFQQGEINRETFLDFADARVEASGMSPGSQRLEKIRNRLTPSGDELAFKKNWDEAAMGVARFAASMYALEAPFKKFYHFIDALKQANLQFANLSQSANTTAGALASQSGLAAASGSSAAAYANFRRSFEMEMEKRNVGMGNGGQFTQALARYGISFDPSSFDATMRNIVAFMSDPTKSNRQRQMAGQMLGMDQGMISAAMRGQDFYDKYTKETKSLTTNSDAAAEASRELSLETQKLALVWQNFKNGIFADLQPFINFAVQIGVQIGKLVNIPIVRVLIEISAGIFAAWKAWKMLHIALTAGKLALSAISALFSKSTASALTGETSLAATRKAGLAAAAALNAAEASLAATRKGSAVASGVSGVVSTAGGIAGGIGNAAGSLGKTAEGAAKMAGKAGGLAMLGPAGAALAVVDVISGVTNTVMGGIQRHNTNVRLDKILALLTQRIPSNLVDAMGEVMIRTFSMRGFKGVNTGANGVKIENINVKVEYLGESKDELVSEIGKEIEGNLKTSLKGLLT